ncbi:uncharacterized protein LOC132185215 [Corylus avellana]|uniref:uncharacterized protein LOC132185215 n=1 Tax=Corylus avellana TaxID=13451 RepID=UPI00286AC6E0|nr:uncharacterized protein LOC132185215 [Corylus avellana]
MRFPLPEKFKVRHVDKYDGSGDPTDHMKSFQAHLALHDTPDEIACQAFLLTLKGDAREWFGKFLPKSINNFDFLGRQFITQFLAIQKRKKSPAYLLSLVKGKNESLKDYMIRFNREKLSVESQKEEMKETIGALMKPKGQSGQGEASSSKVAPRGSRKMKKEEKSPKTCKKLEPFHQRNQRLTPLNTSNTEVFMEIKGDPNFRWPSKMRTP